MGGQTDGQMDGLTDGRQTDGWMGGWMDGQTGGQRDGGRGGRVEGDRANVRTEGRVTGWRVTDTDVTKSLNIHKKTNAQDDCLAPVAAPTQTSPES